MSGATGSRRVGERGGVADLVSVVFGDFAEDTGHDFAGARFKTAQVHRKAFEKVADVILPARGATVTTPRPPPAPLQTSARP